MKWLTLSLCVLGATISSTAVSADRRIAFERDDAVYIANLDATVIRKLTDGIFPAISPDATQVAFTSVKKSGENYVRQIAAVDIASGRTKVFTDVPSDNAYGASWSPDGKWIAFSLRSDGVWHLGMVKGDGTTFNFIKKGYDNTPTLYSVCWARDGQSVFCQDMTNIYRLSLGGSVLAQWKIDQIIPNGGMTGDGRIDVSPNGKRLLLSVDMDEEHNRKNWDGPVPALWSFDLETQVAVRLTSKNLFAWDGCWLDDANILFLSQREAQPQPSLYRTNGQNLKRIIESSRRPSVNPP